MAPRNAAKAVKTPGRIRVGIGGWSYAPWRETFYPEGVTAKKELPYAASKLTAIEINSTFYRNPGSQTFRKWAEDTPDDFQFAVKAPRFATSRKDPSQIGEAVDWFVDGGVLELGCKLGPINWQFRAGRPFDPDYFKAFLKALPRRKGKRTLRHAIEVRHPSFRSDEFYDLLRRYECALVAADAPDWTMDDIDAADFAYVRLQQSAASCKTGYPPKALRKWADTLNTWAQRRDVFAFFISGAKERNPAAAHALIARLG